MTNPDPAVVSLRCLAAEPGAVYNWHDHPFYEFTFVSDDNGAIGYSNEIRQVRRDALLFYHRRERHAGGSGVNQRPRFWVVHFTVPDEFLRGFPSFLASNPASRHWNLRSEQADAFRWMFVQILNERTRSAVHRPIAESAWLRLMLVNVHRWVTNDDPAPITPGDINPDLMKLWHMVNACVGQPAEFQQRIPDLPNYDSLRHGFKRIFGMSPTELLMSLRIQHAKNLLLESNMNIKEIAYRSGYHRQNEFARAFRQHTGVSPTAWREQPLARRDLTGK
jgi:hypothetical protein